jgi:hypothetical protein
MHRPSDWPSRVWAAGLVVVLASAGCRVCPVPEDMAYGYYGGITARANPYWGRVGSAFDDGSTTDEVLEEDSSVELVDPP